MRKKRFTLKRILLSLAVPTLFVSWYIAGYVDREVFYRRTAAELKTAQDMLAHDPSVMDQMGLMIECEDGSYIALRVKNRHKRLPNATQEAGVVIDSSGQLYKGAGFEVYRFLYQHDPILTPTVKNYEDLEAASEALAMYGFVLWKYTPR